MFQFYLNFRSALGPCTNTKRKAKNVAEPGVEPSTCDALGGCSTDWAMEARYRPSLLATRHSRPSREAKNHQSVEGSFSLFTQQITIRAFGIAGYNISNDGDYFFLFLFLKKGPAQLALALALALAGPAPGRVAAPIAAPGQQVHTGKTSVQILHLQVCN